MANVQLQGIFIKHINIYMYLHKINFFKIHFNIFSFYWGLYIVSLNVFACFT